MEKSDGSIDITLLVEAMGETFVRWANLTIFAAVTAVPFLAWLRLPIISNIFKFGINWCVETLVGTAMMHAFFLNTAIRKNSQAKEYIEALAAKNSLPPTATDAEYLEAEKNEIKAFNLFVRITT